MQREEIELKKVNKNISILKEIVDDQEGLALIMHGHGAIKEQAQLEAIANTFLDNNYSVIRFDCVHSTGKSKGGKYEDATTSNYLEDLIDVIEWAKTQKFYQLPVIVGHSLGGMCVTLYAKENSVKALGLLSPVISGELSLSKRPIDELLKWKQDKVLIRESTTTNGVTRRIKWMYAEDLLTKSLLTGAEKLDIPILLIVGEKDTLIPPTHATLFYWKLACPKEFHIISDAGHDFHGETLDKVKYLFDNWIKKL